MIFICWVIFQCLLYKYKAFATDRLYAFDTLYDHRRRRAGHPYMCVEICITRRIMRSGVCVCVSVARCGGAFLFHLQQQAAHENLNIAFS